MQVDRFLRAFFWQLGHQLNAALHLVLRYPFIPTVRANAHVLADAVYLQQIQDLVERHLDDPGFSVDALCQECHTSQPQLYRKITNLSGLSPCRFIRSIRLQKAQALLRRPGLTITDVAYETGFTSPAYFTRIFRKMFGITPSAYRRRFKEHSFA